MSAQRRLLLIALALGALATATVLHNQRAVGVPRDEVVYMHAGSRYAEWWSGLFSGKTQLSKQSITAHFGGASATDNNREHPPLLKTLSGLSERVFHDRLGALDELTAYRLPAALLHGALIALIALFAGGIWGTAAGVIAALLMLLMPRPLFHAGLACFDGPIATLWFATVVAYHRALVTGRRAWLAGVCFGLALATKHNALLLPFAVTAHYALTAWLRRGVSSSTPRSATQRLADAARALWQLRPGVLIAMALVGPLVLFLVWPWLWLSPVRHVAQWIAFHTHHVHYNFEYLGHNWNAPPFPWHVPLVTTWLTVPVITLVASLAGTRVMTSRALGHGATPSKRADDGDARSVDGDALSYRPGLLLLLSLAASAGPFFLRTTPIFGAEKHWEPAIPTLCIAAGVGLVASARGAARWLARRWPRVPLFSSRRFSPTLVALVGGVALLSSAIETFHPQPYGLTAYNALAGGAPGAADLGMNRQFWGIAARDVLPELADVAPPPGAPPLPVYTHDAAPSWGVYRHLGLLPAGLPDAGGEAPGIARSELALVIHERHFARHDFMIWQSYGTVKPIFVLRLDGVPLVSLYRRPPPAASPR